MSDHETDPRTPTTDLTTDLTTDPVTEELLGWIQQSVRHLAACADGLTEAQLRRPAAPSGWSVLGMLEHVRDSTVFWLEHVVAGVPMQIEDPDWDHDEWRNDPPEPAAEVLDRLRRDVERACAGVRHVSSTAAPGWWPEGAWGGYRQHEVRGVLLHLLYDNVAHTGQLDVAREGIDGAVWDFATGAVRVP